VSPRLAPVLLLALPVLAVAQTDSPRLSVRPHEAIVQRLPPFEPKPVAAASAPDTPPDPDVIVLPKVVVEEKELPRITPDELLTAKGRTEILMARRSSPLDRALNRIRIPALIGGISPEQRVNWEYNVNRDWHRRSEIHDLEKADKAHRLSRPPGD
jgi:hypothetical protein